MKRYLVTLIRFCAVATLALILGAFSSRPVSFSASPIAQDAQSTNFTLEGKITQRSEGKLTVSTDENIIFHVRYDEKTSIKRSDGSDAAAQELRVGIKIAVEGDLTDSGEIVARKIQLHEKADSKPR